MKMKHERSVRGGWLGVTFAAVAFVVLATVAFAGGGPTRPMPLPVMTMHPITMPPAPAASVRALPPVLGQTCGGLNLKTIRPGTRVPLSCLPRLPMKTKANTMTPALTAQSAHGRARPMAATGATIDFTSGSNCGSTGAIYSIGCSLTWQAENNTDYGNSTAFQDYYVAPNSTTATSVGATYANNASTAHTTTLSTAGTYAFFVYDTVNKVIVSIAYANAGQSFQIGVYQDPYHTQPSYQFDVSCGCDAYIYLPDVSTTDTYVVYVMETAVTSYCVFITPAATPQPAGPTPVPTGPVSSLICNPSTSTGINAPSGTLSLQWPLNTSYQAGTYAIVVYDATANETVGQVNVSLTGTQDNVFVLYPTPGAAPTPAAPATPPATVYAWDSTTEQSDAGVVATVANLTGTAPTNGVYTMTATDPDGQVVELPVVSPSPVPATCTASTNTSASCTVTGTFSFSGASPALHAPGEYPNNVWTMQLYNPTTKTVYASQAFQIVGYSVQPLFNISGTLGDTLNFGCCAGGTYNQAANIVFTNSANTNYPNAADPIAGIEFSMGPASTLNSTFTPPSNTTGYGVTMTLTGCTGTANYNTTGCSLGVTDSKGGSWTAYDYCSTATPTAPAKNSQCVIKLVPASGITLAAGATITVPGTFYAQAGSSTTWSCYNTPCSTATSILPADGITWSSTSTSSPAWTPLYFSNTNGTILGTADAEYIGSCTVSNCATTGRNVVAVATNPPTTPWTNTHFYPATFAHGELQNSTPFAISSGREDVLVITLADCGSSGSPAPSCTGTSAHNLDEIGITFPAGISASTITVDPSNPSPSYVLATTGGNSCNGTLPDNAICLNPGGSNTGVGVTPGNTGQIWLDVPAAEASYIAQDIRIQSWNNSETTWTTLTSDGNTTTPVVGGGVAGTAVDSLSNQMFSLNSNLMAAQFDPSVISPGLTTTTYTLDFTNTSTAADANPDPIDSIVIEQVANKNWTLTAPSFSGTGSSAWTTTGENTYNPSGNLMLYYFGVCNFTYSNRTTDEPPQNPSTGVTYPTTAQTTPSGTKCTAAQENDSIAAGGSLDITFTLANLTAGVDTFYVYAHGANSGAWSAPKTVTVTLSAEAAKVQLYSVNQGSTDASCSTSTGLVATNTVATVAKSPNCFIYEITNTSGNATQNIGTIDIALPAFDINGLATSIGPPIDWSLVGSPVTQYVVLGKISAGSFVTTGLPAGCAINAGNTFNPTAGSTPGQIQISGCTAFYNTVPDLAVEFVANTPSTESDSYLLPVTVDGANAGLAWAGSDEVSVAYSLGLSVTVDPSNPGPGGSHPSVTCTGSASGCAFSGTTLDFGQINSGGTAIGTDVVRATVVYEGATLAGTCPANAGAASNTWQLQVSLSAANPSNELFTSVDNTNSTSGLTYNVAGGVESYFNPTTSTTTLACGNETSSTDYDVLNNFEASIGTDTTAHTVTVTYTLIGN